MADFWRVPVLWPGETVAILGGGPSLKTLDLSLLRGKRVIAVNCAYKLGRFDAVFFGDGAFVQRHAPDLPWYDALRVTRCREYLDQDWVRVVPQAERPSELNDWPMQIEGISIDPSVICWNSSSGGCAVNLATLLGAKRIVLLGYDMRTIETKHNWHDFYPDNDVTAHVDDYERFRRPFIAIKRDLDALGIECVNATPGSALTVFPIMTPEEALC